MFSNRLIFGALALACIAAAGAGGYFASRQNTVPTPASAEAPSTAALSAPVHETEAVVGDTVPDAAAPQSAGAPETSQRTSSASLSRRPEPARSTTASATSARSAEAPARQSPPAPERALPATPTPTQAPAVSATSAPAATPAADGNAGAADDRAALELPRAPEPPQKIFEELVVSPNSVIGLQTETRISSEAARLEDRVEAKVSRDVKVGDSIAIPAGSRVIGSVVQVQRGGKFKERARLGIRFTTLVLADGTRMSMSTETIYREGEAPANSSAAKIGGGAVGGAILGAILGGAKGAAIGATAGAGGGVAAVEAGDRSEVTLPAGSPLTVRLLTPLAVTVEQQ